MQKGKQKLNFIELAPPHHRLRRSFLSRGSLEKKSADISIAMQQGEANMVSANFKFPRLKSNV